MSEPEARPPLLHLVALLRRAGLPISVGQYLEGLRALELVEAPFTYLAPVGRRTIEAATDIDRHRVALRDRLVWFAQTIWARSDEERQIVRRVIESELPLASPSYALMLTEAIAGRSFGGSGSVPEPPARLPEDVANEAQQAKAAADEEALAVLDDSVSDEPADAPSRYRDNLLPLPPITDSELPRSNPYTLTQSQMVSPLWLAALWRRFQEPRYVEDRSRIDVERSVASTVRAGGVPVIVHARRRQNAAQLLVLIDAGVAMAPWRALCDEIVATLAPETSRLDKVIVGYFSGAPGRHLESTPDLARPRPTAELLREAEGMPVLVFGEAGAARPPRHDLLGRLEQFIAATLARGVRPLVWVNPMPEARWQSGFRRAIAESGHGHALALSDSNLLQAVDILRGQQ